MMSMHARNMGLVRIKPVNYFFRLDRFRIALAARAPVAVCIVVAAAAARKFAQRTPGASTATGHSPADTATTVTQLQTCLATVM